jgi:pilus assembly protein Flp/PilA
MTGQQRGIFHMKTFLKSFIADESGASAAEYALILVVVGVGIVAAGIALSGSIEGAMCDAAGVIETGEEGGASTDAACTG